MLDRHFSTDITLIMAKQPLTEPKRENEEAGTPTTIDRKGFRKLRQFEGDGAANPSSRERKIKAKVLAMKKPSYCLKRGWTSQCDGESLRFQHRKRLFRILNQLTRQHNWAEASGVLSVLLQGTVKDESLSVNRAKYTAALELQSIIKGENIDPDKKKGENINIKKLYALWMKKIGLLKCWSTKERFAVQLEFILTCLQHGGEKDAYQAAIRLMQQRGFDGDPVANLVVGLAFSQLWYSQIPEANRLTELDSSSAYMQSELPLDNKHMPVEYSKGNDALEGGEANSVIQCDSNTSIAYDKEAAEVDGNEQKDSMDVDTNVKMEVSNTSYERQEVHMKSAEASGRSNHSSHGYNGDVPDASIFYTQGLPPWVLPMKLPTSHENLEDALNDHRKLHNDEYENALKHLRVALYSTPPVSEAFHPLIQMLILGDEVCDALEELKTHTSDTVLQLRLKACLLEHFHSDNYLKICTCFEDILKKDPTCSDSLARLILLHQRGDYDAQNLVEMIALHLDASYGTSDTWQELASCFLKLCQCEVDRISINGGCSPENQGYLDDSTKVPELFTSGRSGKAWRLRSRWWLNRHFHHDRLMSDIESGDLKLLTNKAATASHIYGRHFKYAVKATEYLEKVNEMELYSFLQTHILNSVGFYNVKLNST